LTSISTIRFTAEPPSKVEANVESTLFHINANGSLRAGYWTAKAGYQLQLTGHPCEFCTILEGFVTLTNTEGKAESYRQGDSFIIPAGYQGIWDTQENCRKFFVIYDDKVK
jgi:uncharacterized cupin superfamily protein